MDHEKTFWRLRHNSVPQAHSCQLPPEVGKFPPPALRWGIPKGQYLRVRLNCSSFNNFKKESDILQKRFSDRGYPNKTLKKAYQHASTQNRLDLLTKKMPTKTDDITRIIGTYDMAAPEVRNILDTFWPILRRDPFGAEFIPGRPSLTFRRGRNVGDFVVHSHYVPPTNLARG